MYAKKAIAQMFNREVEMYQLPDGKYHMSKTQMANVIEKRHQSVAEFLQGKSPEALPYKDFSFAEIAIDGNNGVFHSVPFEIVIAYFSYWARQGNEIAMSIMQNCTLEYMNRVADSVFGVEKDEDDYRSEFKERESQMEALAQLVNLVTELHQTVNTMKSDNVEYRQLKSNGIKHPGCLGVLEKEVEFDACEYITAREYLAQKHISNWELAQTFSRRTAQAMRVGKNICKLPMHRNQVIYSPEDIGYLDETLKSMMGL